MKTASILGFALILSNVHAQRLTTDDPNFRELSSLADGIGWYQNSQTKSWTVADGVVDNKGKSVCMGTLDKLRAAGVADTRTVEIHWDGPEFKQGVHTLAEIRTSCEHVERIGKIKSFEFWALLAMQDAPKVASGRGDSLYFKNCIEAYDRIVKAGVSPSEHVPARVIAGTDWSGSIEEIRQKWCDTGLSKAKGNAAEHEAPFRKELSADKLRLALKYGSFFLPGGAGTGDAHKLAGSSVWFLDLSPPRHCVDGRQVHAIRRYQFGPDQRLVKTTEHEYCGKAPSSAFQ